ncbi:MAG: inositol monophosphatase family protein [Actinobacteria bacterium]|nr:inositol monophosphatase family protein [Actinomycetota bacterium]
MVDGIAIDGRAVESAIVDVASAEVLPRLGVLGDDEIEEKSPGDLVTVADAACERALAERLRSLVDLPVLGEEAAAEDPSLLGLVATAEAVWVIDPIDGTSNFAAGSPDFAVMVSLVQHGRTTHGWMHLPVAGSMLHAELGAGTWRDGAAVDARPPRPDAVGLLKRGYLPAAVRDRLGTGPALLRDAVHGIGSCPFDYDAVVRGTAAFVLYWRTLPWDHTAPALYAAESGLRVARPGGDPYEPGDGRSGLLVAHPSRWGQIDAAFGSLR